MKNKKDDNRLLIRMGMTRENLYIFFAGIISIILGYLALAAGDTYDTLSLTVGPVLLVLGYVVILPLSIMYRSRSDR